MDSYTILYRVFFSGRILITNVIRVSKSESVIKAIYNDLGNFDMDECKLEYIRIH